MKGCKMISHSLTCYTSSGQLTVDHNTLVKSNLSNILSNQRSHQWGEVSSADSTAPAGLERDKAY